MTENQDPGQPHLENWLEGVPAHSKALAWCHTTRAFLFREMVRSGECRIQLCKTLAEHLLYLFYGRPAYRLGDDPMSKSCSLPVVLLFDPSLVESGKRVYPFDSGAFASDRMQSWMDPKMELAHFELQCAMDTVQRFVAAFYESNDAYLRGEVRKDIKRDVKKYGGEFEVSSLVSLFQGIRDRNLDDRIMAVELQLATSVLLSPKYLKAVIYPDELEEAAWFTSFLERFRQEVTWDGYKPHHAKLTSEYQGHLEERARTIQVAFGYV
jgi:hypothetical protein